MYQPVFLLLALSLSITSITQAANIERDGFVEVESETFVSQSENSVRSWYLMDENTPPVSIRDLDENHFATASNGRYIELLPDTRVDHSEILIKGENFSNEPGKMAIINYEIEFNTPGKYVVWVSGFSTGSEDNGVHIGINGTWPESGQRIQWCEGKNEWTWTSAQRVEHNHCGYPKTIFLNIPTKGTHTISFSMREDGVELDRFIMVNDENFQPEDFVMPAKDAPFEERVSTNGDIQLSFENYQIDGHIPFYRDYGHSAYAINAANENYRDGFALAETVFKGETGTYNLRFKTLGEIDGESNYRILLNNKIIGSFQNDETEVDYEPNYFTIENVTFHTGDKIGVQSSAHTNGKIPENDSTAWSRGRWQSLLLLKQDNHSSH